MPEAQGLLEQLRMDFVRIDATIASRRTRLQVRETGTVVQVGQGIALVEGLPSLRSEELVELGDGQPGIALDIHPDRIGVVLLSSDAGLQAGSPVKATGRLADTPVGERLLGRVIDAAGKPLDGGNALQDIERWPIERPAPPIIERAPVSTPLATGLTAVDALVPIGRGQRELIAGDRQTGKTSLALDAILNQKDKDVICIYCAIGQRASAVARVVQTLRDAGGIHYSIVVVASGDDPPGLQYITPFAATTMAEWFMRRGRDVLIVYDDLTRHARAYRELSLLLRRPPGREAFPGDIFYLHSRLLERSARLNSRAGGGSLTALPIVETQAQNLSAYIPTNLVSITDGQIYLSPVLQHQGVLPAVDIGKSVSRVGSRAQLPAYRELTGDLRLSYAQFEELESFARFGTRLDEATRTALERGKRTREVLKQREHDPIDAAEQIAMLLALNHGLFDRIGHHEVSRAARLVRAVLRETFPALAHEIRAGGKLAEDSRGQLLNAMRESLAGAFPIVPAP